MDYHRQNSVNIKIVRIFNTYGPAWLSMTVVISNFIVQALRGEDLTIYGDGVSRSFCYISDLVKWLVRMMKR
jgi:UDP-glucuronate decarboxylase